MNQQRGFSLLELLVALLVVVILTSLATLSVNSGGSKVQLEGIVRNLADVSIFALDEAQIQGLDHGLFLDMEYRAGEPTYRLQWLQRQDNVWRTPEVAQELYSPQYLPPGIAVMLELEDLPLPEIKALGEDEEPVPQVYFYASGETTVGAIEFEDEATGELLWRVEWDLLGRFEVMKEGVPDDSR